MIKHDDPHLSFNYARGTQTFYYYYFYIRNAFFCELLIKNRTSCSELLHFMRVGTY